MTAMIGQVQVHSTEEQAEVVAPWDASLRQISPGAFEGSMQFASLNDILVYRDCWSQRTLAGAALPGDYFMIGGITKPAHGFNWCGKDTDEQRLAIALPDTQVDFLMPSQTTYVAMILPVRYLNALFGDGETASTRRSFYHYSCPPGLGERLLARVSFIIDHCLANPGLLEDPTHRDELELCVIDDLAEIDFSQKNVPSRMPISARRKLLRRALEYGESIRDKISVPQFSEQLKINRRSLERAFRECLGITPRQYLLYRRLHGVHGDLRRLPPRSHHITEVANNWGFTELGRFSGDYKNLFGELPRDTLNRSTAREPQRLVDLLH